MNKTTNVTPNQGAAKNSRFFKDHRQSTSFIDNSNSKSFAHTDR